MSNSEKKTGIDPSGWHGFRVPWPTCPTCLRLRLCHEPEDTLAFVPRKRSRIGIHCLSRCYTFTAQNPWVVYVRCSACTLPAVRPTCMHRFWDQRCGPSACRVGIVCNVEAASLSSFVHFELVADETGFLSFVEAEVALWTLR